MSSLSPTPLAYLDVRGRVDCDERVGLFTASQLRIAHRPLASIGKEAQNNDAERIVEEDLPPGTRSVGSYAHRFLLLSVWILDLGNAGAPTA